MNEIVSFMIGAAIAWFITWKYMHRTMHEALKWAGKVFIDKCDEAEFYKEQLGIKND